jgi:uncharacterized RDD family membrane protein YckC
VNQRIAAHRNRKGTAGSVGHQDQVPKSGESRAAAAAARVAARYAKAPSYTQLQAEEARAAVRAAEIAVKAAIEAREAAESALVGSHTAAVEQPLSESPRQAASLEETVAEPIIEPDPEQAVAVFEEPTGNAGVVRADHHSVVTPEVVDGKSFNLRWEPDLPALGRRMSAAAHDQNAPSAADWWTPAQVSATLHSEPIEVDAPTSQANLIEFPREVVAPRKIRPRLAEVAAGIAVEPEAQLSIFEVDPGAVSYEPMTEDRSKPSLAELDGPVWSGIELDADPVREEATHAEPAVKHGRHLAPFGLRLMAMVIDGSLILGAFFAAAMGIASKLVHIPSPKPAEILAGSGLLLTGFAYHALFFALGKATPGMRYAGIALCTFDDDVPTRDQLWRRLGAMALSLLPVGLGLVWSVFDEDHLSWHDRISGTYLRKR